MRDFHLPGRSEVFAAQGMCATSHPLAAEEAVKVLREGGNAVDAAITGAVMLGLLEPAMTGIGGDAFALIWKPGAAKPIGLNGSGRAPKALEAAALRAQGLTEIETLSANAVTVPGAIDAFDTMLRDHGTRGWEEVLRPSITLAREGAIIAPRVAFDYAEHASRLMGEARKHFLLPDGRIPGIADRLSYPAQADALELIAQNGRDGFYSGPLAEDMVNSLNVMGGLHTLDDFAATACNYVEPISGDYRGTTLWELPPNGQGATALLMLAMLEGFDLSRLDPLGAERAHLEAETARLAYHARDCLIGDSDREGAAARLAHILSGETAVKLRTRIDPARRRADLLEGLGSFHRGGAAHKDTIYITVADKDGMMVSLIYSIFHAFGSGLASTRYGINFQCRGAGFSLEEGHPNELQGGKRPMHTIIPAMLSRGAEPIGSFGVMGGAYQPNGHARVLSNLVDYGMSAQSALDAARSFASGNTLDIERGYAEPVKEALGAMGHQLVVPATAIGGGQMILRDAQRGVLIGGSDHRKDGCAIGY